MTPRATIEVRAVPVFINCYEFTCTAPAFLLVSGAVAPTCARLCFNILCHLPNHADEQRGRQSRCALTLVRHLP